MVENTIDDSLHALTETRTAEVPVNHFGLDLLAFGSLSRKSNLQFLVLGSSTTKIRHLLLQQLTRHPFVCHKRSLNIARCCAACDERTYDQI